MQVDYLKTHISKIMKFAMFGVNCALMFPRLAESFTLVNLGVFLAIYLIFFFVLYKSPDAVPMCAYVPWAILADVCCWGGMNFPSIRESIEFPGALEYLPSVMDNKVCAVMLATGVVAGIAGVAKDKLAWLSGVGGMLIGTAVLLYLWGDGIWGAAFFPVFVLGFAFWSFLLQYITVAAPAKRTSSLWIGVFLFLAVMTIAVCVKSSSVTIYGQWEAFARALPHSTLAWWKVIVAVILLIASYMFLDDLKSPGAPAEYEITLCTAIFLLSTRLLCTFYFTWNWCLLLLLLVGCYKSAAAEMRGTYLLDMANDDCALGQTLLFGAALVLMRDGLWINVLVTVAFVPYFYRRAIGKGGRPMDMRFWFMVLLCVGAESAAWMWVRKYSPDGFILLATIIILAFIAALILGKPHPAGLQSAAPLRVLLCVATGVLCILTANRYGVKMSAGYNDGTSSIRIQVEAKGKENAVGDVYYYWCDRFGKQSSGEIPAAEPVFEILPKDELLVVVADDAEGVRATRYFWFPRWRLPG